LVTALRKQIVAAFAVLCTFSAFAGSAAHSRLTIPDVAATPKRLVTIEDLVALRNISSLSVSPDGRHVAVFVYQADAEINDYHTAWLIYDIATGKLTRAGDGGQVRPKIYPAGDIVGDIEGRQARWSPDGQWIAYLLKRDGEVELWRSRADGTVQEQLTHNAADVRDFAWREDGRALYFSVGTPRATQQASDEARSRLGYRYDEDLLTFTDFMKTQLWRPLETDLEVWAIALDSRVERLGDQTDRTGLARAQTRDAAGIEPGDGFVYDTVVPAVTGAKGALAWLERTGTASRALQVRASLSPDRAHPIACANEQCRGPIYRVWWSARGDKVLFWRGEGINDRAHGFYAWSPSTGEIERLLFKIDDDFRYCAPAANDEVICARESTSHPPDVVALDLRAGTMREIADINPEFRNVRLGKVERFEWDTPRFDWNEAGGALAGLYPKRAYGYIVYPPNFDPRKKYPVFMDPYVAHEFAPLGNEHPLHVYAANAFVVLKSAFPLPNDVLARLGASAMKKTYSAELDFPHLTMLMESTVRALEVAKQRGFIEERRVGIGGVSHGTFVPLYMMQKHDLISAISISSPTWGPHEYYWGTGKINAWVSEVYGVTGAEDWRVKPEGAGRAFWSRIDIADHIDAIEAPILMNLAADETYALIKLIRHLADGRRPYDAYVFRDETHIKWQPAHLEAIYQRNLDWFRFWLQNYEDPAPVKVEQYTRWRKLRELQCGNPRGLLRYCD
jgi:dipeptidyl aminopeptidase/acylaminoacyl peptidase